MNFKTLILLSLILLGGICTGCDRFLDVQPKDQYTEKQLLATRGGYYTAMNFQFVIWQKSLIRIDRCHFKKICSPG